MSTATRKPVHAEPLYGWCPAYERPDGSLDLTPLFMATRESVIRWAEGFHGDTWKALRRKLGVRAVRVALSLSGMDAHFAER